MDHNKLFYNISDKIDIINKILNSPYNKVNNVKTVYYFIKNLDLELKYIDYINNNLKKKNYIYNDKIKIKLLIRKIITNIVLKKKIKKNKIIHDILVNKFKKHKK